MSKRARSKYVPVVLNDLCRNPRCKGMYVGAYAGIDPHTLPADTTNWWCERTQVEVGPDDHPCHGDRCVRGRACYEPDRDDAELVS